MHCDLLDCIKHLLKRGNGCEFEFTGEHDGRDDEEYTNEEGATDVHDGDLLVVPSNVEAHSVPISLVDV
jgi:hypothetical protein